MPLLYGFGDASGVEFGVNVVKGAVAEARKGTCFKFRSFEGWPDQVSVLVIWYGLILIQPIV